MRTLILTCIFGFTFAAARCATAHDDIVPYSSGGKIMTGGHNDTTNGNTISLRVFGYDFGEFEDDPYFIGDPGFNNGSFGVGVFPNNGLLPFNAASPHTLAFDVLTTLQYWNGTGPVSFAAAPLNVSLGLNRSATTVTISGTSVTGTPPTIAPTSRPDGLANGRVHQHMNSLLNYAGSVDPLAPNAPGGIYAVGIRLKLPGSGLSDSDPIFLVYNNGLGEAQHDAALDWVAEHLVIPEPATWGMALVAIALAAAAACRKQQHRARSNA